jgi:hypothetical protein
MYNKAYGTRGLHKTPDALQFQRFVRKKLNAYIPVTCPVILTVHFYFETSTRDIDNCLKLLLDAFETRLYSNDSQIVELHVYKFRDKEKPRAEVVFVPKPDASSIPIKGEEVYHDNAEVEEIEYIDFLGF